MAFYAREEINVREVVNNMVKNIKEYMEAFNLKNIIGVTIMNGGVQLAIDILKEFHPEKSDYHHYFIPIHVKSYNGQQKGQTIIKYFDEQEFKQVFDEDSLVLIIDDILDTGETIKLVKSKLQKLTDNYPYIKVATLITSEKSTMVPSFTGYIDPIGKWWIGYGMDDNGYNRFSDDLYYTTKFLR